MEILTGKDLVKRFGEKDILTRVNINIPQHAAIAIAGATGSGKSTLLKILAGLIEPDSGEVLHRGKKVEGPLTKLIPGHDKIGYLSQYFELRNNYRVEEIFDYSNKIEETKAIEIFERCNITHLLKRRTDQLSGGEKQRVALARVLITGPDILLLDEPFSNLDLAQKTSVKNVLATVIKAFQLTTVLVSHDPSDLLPFADIIHVMQNGQIIQSDSPHNIYYHPKDDYVAGLFGQYTVINNSLRAFLKIPDNIKFLRPEMLSIKPGNQGIIQSTQFMGGFWQAKVIVNGQTMICNYTDSSLQKGHSVSINY
jgi:ABC-type sugar transport system ATPase subunit